MKTITAPDIEKAFDYESYYALMTDLVAEGKTTGPKQGEEMAHYTMLNHRRMRRIVKTTKLLPETIAAVKAISSPQIWFIITEAWCGDAAQIIPILQRMAMENPLVELKLILRDENLPIMDQYLTGTARAIPMVIILDANDLTELAVWGPRPEEAQALVMTEKAKPDFHYTKLIEELQVWYNHDKTIKTQQEMTAVLNKL